MNIVNNQQSDTLSLIKDAFARIVQLPSKHIIRQKKIRPGQSVYAVNKETGEVTEAKTTGIAKISSDSYTGMRKVVVEPGFDYVIALNKKNAIKKIQDGKQIIS